MQKSYIFERSIHFSKEGIYTRKGDIAIFNKMTGSFAVYRNNNLVAAISQSNAGVTNMVNLGWLREDEVVAAEPAPKEVEPVVEKVVETEQESEVEAPEEELQEEVEDEVSEEEDNHEDDKEDITLTPKVKKVRVPKTPKEKKPKKVKVPKVVTEKE